MTIDPKELTRDQKFWASELDVQEQALPFMRQLARMRPYDIKKINPSTYDTKMIHAGGRQQQKLSEKQVQKKRDDAIKK